MTYAWSGDRMSLFVFSTYGRLGTWRIKWRALNA